MDRTPPRNPPDASGVDIPRSLSEFPAALVRATLDKVVASGTFRRSLRHRRFLEYIVRAGLDGRHDQLKETIVGIEVFGRTLDDYDPQRDPIVRVEAGRIRRKLARYYDGEGRAEPFRLLIPIGSYLPQLLSRTATPPSSRVALAVLPFANLANDADDAVFLLGLVDQLIDTVGRIRGLAVVARPSSLKARDDGAGLKDLGRRLGVDHVIDGSLQRSGSRVRCVVHLTRLADRVRIWSERFDDADDDLFAYQDRIADAVLLAASALQASTDPAPTTHRQAGTRNREARNLYERARYLNQKKTNEAHEKAAVLLDRAIALDPGFAQGHSQLGTTLMALAGMQIAPDAASFVKAERVAQRAIELDPFDGEARALMGTITYRIDRRWNDAEPMFQDALRLAPNSTLVHSHFALSLAQNGRFDEAMRHVAVARRIDPLNIALQSNNAAVAIAARQYDLAIAEFEEVLEREPDHLYSQLMLGLAHLMVHDHDPAMAHLARACELGAWNPSTFLLKISAHGLRGEFDEGHRELDALMRRIGDGDCSRFNLAGTLACLGDADGCFANLEHAATVRDVRFVGLPAHPFFGPYRADPRYADLLRRSGLHDVVPHPDPAWRPRETA